MPDRPKAAHPARRTKQAQAEAAAICLICAQPITRIVPRGILAYARMQADGGAHPCAPQARSLDGD